MVELQLVMYIIQIVMLKLVCVMDFMPLFIDCKLLYSYCSALLKKLVVALLGVVI